MMQLTSQFQCLNVSWKFSKAYFVFKIMYTWIKGFTYSVAPKLLLWNATYINSRIIASVFEDTKALNMALKEVSYRDSCCYWYHLFRL